MNKKHWNTVLIGTGAPEGQLCELIDHSYELVRASLPKAVKALLAL
jgi:predicted DNA-binding protein (MmcQ/YjbR family)